MADADVSPYDFEEYGKEIGVYITAAKQRGTVVFTGRSPDFTPALAAAQRLQFAGANISVAQKHPSGNTASLNQKLIDADRALLLPHGLPGRPWFRHAIYAPGRHAGYAAAVIPGVNDAIDDKDFALAEKQINALALALDRAAEALESDRPSAKR
jgi:N-acetylated-alpha-linked acidic dipeptidase